MINPQEMMNVTWGIWEWLDLKHMPPLKTKQIHILVVVPGFGVKAAPPVALRHPMRIKRWNALNEKLRQIKKRKYSDLDSSAPYVGLWWSDIERIEPVEDFKLQPSAVADEDITLLYERFMELLQLYEDSFILQTGTRVLFVAAIIEAVARILGDVKVQVDERVEGRRVETQSCFDFVLKRGAKRISITVAKHAEIDYDEIEDLLDVPCDRERGMIENVLGLEALADVSQLEVAYGISTDVDSWVFLRMATT